MKILISTISIICLLFFYSNGIQIQIGNNQATIAQKRKVYCLMISYHFLDYDIATLNAFTQGFGDLKSQVFRNKVAYRLSYNCQQKITTQQVMELSKLIQKPQGHQREIQTLQHKYIQYFSPQKQIVHNLLKQVDSQSNQQINRQIQKFHQQRKYIEQQAQIFSKGIKKYQTYLKAQSHHIHSSLSKFYQSFNDIHGNLTQGINKLKIGLNQTIQDIKNHPHVKMAQDYWNDLWNDQL